jgi:hypothetical protein
MGNFEDFGLKFSGWKFHSRGNQHAKFEENQRTLARGGGLVFGRPVYIF